MEKIIVQDGHLWKDGQKLTLEFGNIEQINALREYEKLIKKFTDDGVSPEVEYDITATATFDCICGYQLRSQSDAEDVGDIDCFKQDKVKCYRCNKQYAFIVKNKTEIHRGKKFYYADELVVVLKDNIKH